MSIDTATDQLRQVHSHVKDHPPDAIGAKDDVLNEFSPIFQPEAVSELTEEEFKRFLLYENNQHWTGLARQRAKMTSDMDQLRSGLSVLVDENRDLASRVTQAKEMVNGMGKATLTAILHVAYPNQYGV